MNEDTPEMTNITLDLKEGRKNAVVDIVMDKTKAMEWLIKLAMQIQTNPTDEVILTDFVHKH